MAGDLASLMRILGLERFHAVAHDRGGYVVQRLALDEPDLVDRVVILGDVPIGEALACCDARFATAWWIGSLSASLRRLAERLINADPDTWYHLDAAAMGAENYADVAGFVADPAVQHTMCEDYRPGLGVDRAADDEDPAAGRKITAALKGIWGTRDDLAELYDNDVAGIWTRWATEVTCQAIDAGHHLMEEAPAEVAASLIEFLQPRPARQ